MIWTCYEIELKSKEMITGLNELASIDPEGLLLLRTQEFVV